MKEVTLKYGGISGALMAILLFATIPFASRIGFNTVGMIMFFGKIAVFIPVYFGIREFRQTVGEGYITFLKAFNVGIFIIVISCLCYGIVWDIIYYWVSPEFPANYFQDFITQLKLHGAKASDIINAQKQFEESQKVLVNPLVNAAYAFTDPLFEGIIMALIFTFILKKKPPTMEISNLN